ncbi:DUF6328 family protein [Gordonia sp. VNQ95]|uniref:DUF6328 family protein n=1 Tax=Gordonia TaxID=2053 RepID=UPI0032B38D86
MHPEPPANDRSDDGLADSDWNRTQRSETGTQRLDRNWSSLLQELRVAQTGVQVLTAFLLTLPFQSRFDVLDHGMRIFYLAVVACAVGSTVLLVTPVALHRALFRRHRLPTLVPWAHRIAYVGLLFLGVALSGSMVVVFDATVGRVPALVAGGCTLAVFAAFWLVLPFVLRRGSERGSERSR